MHCHNLLVLGQSINVDNLRNKLDVVGGTNYVIDTDLIKPIDNYDCIVSDDSMIDEASKLNHGIPMVVFSDNGLLLRGIFEHVRRSSMRSYDTLAWAVVSAAHMKNKLWPREG